MNASRSQTGQDIWVGLDLAKASFEAALCMGPKAFVTRGFETSRRGFEQLLAWCDEHIARQAPRAPVRVVMEATGNCSLRACAWLIELRPQTHPAIINPGYIKAFADSLGCRNKTDKVDARVIARYGFERNPAPTQPPTPEMARLQRLVRERQCLVEQLTAEKNRAGEECDMPEVRKLRQQRMRMLHQQISNLLKLIRETVRLSPQLRRDIQLLDSIPGVGFLVAVSVVAELGDLRRFEHARQLAAFAGLSPRQRTSGTSVRRRSVLCKMGNKRVRPMLHLAARSLVGRTRYAHGRFYQHLLANGKTKRAAIAAVSRKILVLMRAILISQKPYNDQTADQDPRCGKHLNKTPKEAKTA